MHYHLNLRRLLSCNHNNLSCFLLCTVPSSAIHTKYETDQDMQDPFYFKLIQNTKEIQAGPL